MSRSLAAAAAKLQEEDMSQFEGSEKRDGFEALEQEEVLMHNLTDSEGEDSDSEESEAEEEEEVLGGLDEQGVEEVLEDDEEIPPPS